jgi:pimeloyl-ACP methyl ester carboxylesterase
MRRSRLTGGLIVVWLLAGCAAGAASSVPASPAVVGTAPSVGTDPSVNGDASSAPASGDPITGKVDVGGHALFYSCAGTGTPTVFMEHGLGGDVRQWTDVFRAVSEKTRVCDYSRLNAKLSDDAPGIHTVRDSVADAHALLRGIGDSGPVVLVGYSWGGLITQLFASTYPSEVAGIVLVDSNNANEAVTYWRHLTPEQVARDKEETGGPNPEHVDILKSLDEVRAAPAIPDVPLVVVTHTQSDPNEWPPDWDQATFDKLQTGLQADLVKLTSKGSQMLVDGGHDIPEEHPEAVVEAILKVLAAAR